MKECRGCGQRKMLVEYYRHPMMADGYLHHCKTCKRACQRRRDELKFADPEWGEKERQRHRDKAKRQMRKLRLEQPEKYRERMGRARAAWLARNPHKRVAQIAFSNAVRDGKLKRPSVCEDCGAGGRIEGHHDDYGRPLDVRWLCTACHGKTRRKAA